MHRDLPSHPGTPHPPRSERHRPDAPPPERGGEGGSRPDEDTLVRERQDVRPPRLWKVVLHNDDYTPMEFVVDVLVRHFRKTAEQAEQIMLLVHYAGRGVAGTYTRDVAETRVALVTADALAEGHPLLVTAEPE